VFQLEALKCYLIPSLLNIYILLLISNSDKIVLSCKKKIENFSLTFFVKAGRYSGWNYFVLCSFSLQQDPVMEL
jgi:hypothetical protein